jgi:thioredoxin 1
MASAGDHKAKGRVILVKDLADFEARIAKHSHVVVDFSAQWCRPCKSIAPHFDALAMKYPQVLHLKVDVDIQEAVYLKWEKAVPGIPTFLFFLHGELQPELTIDEANPQRLQDQIATFSAMQLGGRGPKHAR